MDIFVNGTPIDPNGENKRKNAVNATMPAAKKEKKRKIVFAIVSVVLAVAMFFAGGLTVWFMLDGEIRTLVKVKKTIDEKYYKEISDETFYGALFETVNGSLLDPYSHYMTADEYISSTQELAGNRSGIGLVFSTQGVEGQKQMRVVRVCGNSPAEEAGVTAGCYVVGFGNTQAEIISSEDFEEFSAFLSGFDAGEPFYIRLRAGETETDVALTKEEYVESYVFYRTNKTAYGFVGKNATELAEKGAPLPCLDDDTAYVRLIQFAGQVEKNFEDVMKLFKEEGKKNLILDLRQNGGGYMDTMQGLAAYFCKNSTERRPIAAVADYGEKKEEFKAKGNVYGEYFAADSRICVLADEGSASASECLLGCMLDYGTIGYGDICLSEFAGVAKTYGKGIMQTTYYLGAKMDALKLTTAEIRWPVSLNSIHGRGILPEDGTKTVQYAEDDDAEITAAVQALFGA